MQPVKQTTETWSKVEPRDPICSHADNSELVIFYLPFTNNHLPSVFNASRHLSRFF